MIGRAVFSSWGLRAKLENVSSLQQSNSLAEPGLRRELAAEAVLGGPCWREPSAAGRAQAAVVPSPRSEASSVREVPWSQRAWMPRVSPGFFGSRVLGLSGFRRDAFVRGEGTSQHKMLLCQLIAHFIPSLKAILLTLVENNLFN